MLNSNTLNWNQVRADFGDTNTAMNTAIGGFSKAGDVFTKMRDRLAAEEQQELENEQWEKTYDEQIRQYEKDFAYQEGRDEIADKHWSDEFNENVRQFGLNYAIDKYNAQTTRQNADTAAGRLKFDQDSWQTEWNDKQKQREIRAKAFAAWTNKLDGAEGNIKAAMLSRDEAIEDGNTQFAQEIEAVLPGLQATRDKIYKDGAITFFGGIAENNGVLPDSIFTPFPQSSETNKKSNSSGKGSGSAKVEQENKIKSFMTLSAGVNNPNTRELSVQRLQEILKDPNSNEEDKILAQKSLDVGNGIYNTQADFDNALSSIAVVGGDIDTADKLTKRETDLTKIAIDAKQKLDDTIATDGENLTKAMTDDNLDLGSRQQVNQIHTVLEQMLPEGTKIKGTKLYNIIKDNYDITGNLFDSRAAFDEPWSPFDADVSLDKNPAIALAVYRSLKDGSLLLNRKGVSKDILERLAKDWNLSSNQIKDL